MPVPHYISLRYLPAWALRLLPHPLTLGPEHPPLSPSYSSRRLHAEFAAERDWDQFHKPRNLLLALVGEVGELAELL